MRIVGVDTVTLYRELEAWGMGKVDQDIVLIQVHTDEGITGISYLPLIQLSRTGGKLTPAQGSHAGAIVPLIEQHFQPLLLGQHPFAVERIWEEMYKSCYRFNKKGLAAQCLSALDVALWDIMGKATNRPVYQLLGGYRDRCPTYVNCNHKAKPDEVARQTGNYAAQGFRAIKIRTSSHNGTLEDASERVRLVREAIGKDVMLLVDATGDWDVPTAFKLMRQWEQYDIAELEEPLPEEDLIGYIRLANSLHVPVAEGAHLFGRWTFREWIEQRAVNIINPDVLSCGGITEFMKIVALASAARIPVVPHASEQIHVHLVAATPACTLLEHFTPDMTLFGGFFHELFGLEEELGNAEDGQVRVPQRPGLGLVINQKVVAKYRVS